MAGMTVRMTGTSQNLLKHLIFLVGCFSPAGSPAGIRWRAASELRYRYQQNEPGWPSG
jgi:hypothetical protein